MKRILPFLSVAALLLAATASFGQSNYGWSLSESDADPCANVGVPNFGVKNIYLWHTYAFGDHMAAADLTAGGTLAPLAFSAINGFLNAGDASHVLLAVGGCPAAPILAGFFLIIDTGGTMTLEGERLTVDCVVNNAYLSGTTGWTSDGSDPLDIYENGSSGCDVFVDYVEDTSWANVKHLYR